MAGHWLCRLACFLLGHGDREWTFGRAGVVWRCQRCQHEELSAVLRRTR
jgi:hypothetical protein